MYIAKGAVALRRSEMGWRGDSAVRSTGFPPKGQRFSSQHPPDSFNPMGSPDLQGHQAHIQCTHIHADKADKRNTFFKRRRRLGPGTEVPLLHSGYLWVNLLQIMNYEPTLLYEISILNPLQGTSGPSQVSLMGQVSEYGGS